MRKNKKDKTNLYDRLKVLNDYLCDKEPTLWDCRGCDYFYVEPDYRTGRCLRYSIRDWILYHMEEIMSSVSRDTTVTLTEEERELLITAIQKCEEIARDCNDADMFVDASSIFACIYDSYRNGELPTVINIYE